MRPLITALLLALAAPAAAAPETVKELLAEFARTPSRQRVPDTGIVQIPEVLAKAGVRRMTVDDWGGNPIPIWLLNPPSAGPDAPVMFVMHGVGRDADRYMAEWVELATAEGLVIIVPEFTRAAFPGTRAYNFGNVLTRDGKPRPRPEWSYSAIDAIFSRVAAAEKLNAEKYILFGHSAGAQFVHRFVLMGGSPKMSRAVSANSGSYTWPIGPNGWPFGVSDLPEGLWQPESAFAAPMLVIQGTADNDPDYPSLPRQPEAMAQGPHRLARGKAFFAAAQEGAKAAGVPFNWSCALVPDVGHDNGGMAPYALKLLRAPALPKGGDCRLMKKITPE